MLFFSTIRLRATSWPCGTLPLFLATESIGSAASMICPPGCGSSTSASVMQDVTDALLARLSTATCAEAFLPLGSPEIGRFTLACALPDPAPTFALYRALRQAGPGGQAQHSDVFFSAYAVHLRSAPAALHRTHVVGWSSYRHGDVHEARSDQLYQAILLTLLPFEAWDMRIAGDVPPILLHD
ncbi:hypothetical protein [Stenotrophomonas sp. PSU-St15]|nr:hypothetical protein [Stenotrophomonas maltophilia]